jgi:hypothetical protein
LEQEYLVACLPHKIEARLSFGLATYYTDLPSPSLFYDSQFAMSFFIFEHLKSLQ